MKSLKLCLMTLYHPIVVTEHIKRHRGEKKNWLPVIVLLVLTLAVRILSIYGTHYPLASVSVRKANLLLECGKLFVPVLTWVLASYMMTTILDGETLLSETLLFSAYALTPYIVFTPILTLLSRIMDGSQIGLFATLEVGVLAWVVLLMILALKEMNGYSVGKSTGGLCPACQGQNGADDFPLPLHDGDDLGDGGAAVHHCIPVCGDDSRNVLRSDLQN